MGFQCGEKTKEPVETLKYRPWELAVKPFQVSPQTYFVAGQSWVGCYLIDTGDGLILIDTAISESLYLLVDSVYTLGYRMRDIKKILISHAHFDHCGGAAALKKMTGARIYLSKEDAKFLTECPEETMMPKSGANIQNFVPDCFYDDEKPVELGNIKIHTLLTPGHTIGTTSFFWEETNPVNGEVYQIGMHGGVGSNTMNDDYYVKSRYLTPDLRDRFLTDCESLKNKKVDIALPSHPNQILILDRAGTYTHESQPFKDDTVWHDFIEERVRQVKERM